MLMKIAVAAALLPYMLAASADSGLPTTVSVLNVSSCYNSTYCPKGKAALSNEWLYLGNLNSTRSWWMSEAGDSLPQWLDVQFGGKECRVTGLDLGRDGACSSPDGAMPKDLTLQTQQHSVWVAEASFTNTINWGGQHHTGFNFTATVVRLRISNWYTDGCYNGRMALDSLKFDLQECACAEGEFLVGNQCLPCPEGFTSSGGFAAECHVTLDAVLNSTRKPHVSLVEGNAGNIHIIVSFEELTEIYDGWQLSYVADITSELEDASPESNCSSHESWVRSRSTLAATFSYHDFDDPCQLNVTVKENSIVRGGQLTVFLILARPGLEPEQVIGQWAYPMQVVYDRELRVMQEVTRIWEIGRESPLPPVHTGGFESKIEFYRTHLFRSIKDPLIYHDGEKAWIVHALTTETFPMTVKWVLLSRSDDPDDTSAVVHNVSGSVQEVAHPSGGVKFSVILRTCEDCYVHIWSMIDVKRRLQARFRRFLRFLLEDSSREYHQVQPLVVWASEDGMDNDDSVIEDVPLILPAQIAGPLAFALSVLVGGLLHFIVHRSPNETGRWTHGKKQSYFAVEILDVCLNVWVFRLCQEAGDLQLEDNGWIARLLMISIAVSGAAFVVELAMALVKPTWLDRHLLLLNTLHVIGEDTFQALLYGLVQVSQTSSNVESSAALQGAILQAVVFIIVKIVMLAEPKTPRFLDYERVPQPVQLGVAVADD